MHDPHAIVASWAALPFAVSLLLGGMPHGAADGSLLWREARTGPRPVVRYLATVSAYAAVIVATLAFIAAAPQAGVAAFLAVSVIHFTLAATRLFHRLGPAQCALISAALITLPFAARPEQTAAVFGLVTARFGGGEFSTNTVTVLGIIGTLAVIAIPARAVLYRADAHARRTAFVIALTLVGLNVAFPPLFAVGLAFLAWHAFPESLRVGRELGARSPLDALVRSHTASLPFLIPTLALVAVVHASTGLPWSPASLAITTLAAYAVLTPGHLLVQEWLAARGAATSSGRHDQRRRTLRHGQRRLIEIPHHPLEPHRRTARGQS